MSSSSLGFEYVNSGKPCPLCGGTSDCRRNVSGGIHCRRTSETSPPIGWHYAKHDAHGFGMFWPDDADDRRSGSGLVGGGGGTLGDSARRRDPLADKIERRRQIEAVAAEIGTPLTQSTFEQIASGRREMTPGERERLSITLGLPADVFDLLPVQYVEMDNGREAYVIPEVNGIGTVTGWGLRFADGDGAKLTYGPRGIIVPTGWECWDRGGPVFIPEGMSDTLALAAMGLSGLGRPSNMYGADILADILRSKGLQADISRAIIVLGENDRKADGTWPGRDGAEFTAKRLSELLGRPIWIGYPPALAKDVREYLRAYRASDGLPEIGRNFREDIENTATVVGAYADVVDAVNLTPPPIVAKHEPVEIVFNPSGLTPPSLTTPPPISSFAKVLAGQVDIIPEVEPKSDIPTCCPDPTPVLMRHDGRRLTRCVYFDCRRIECVYCGVIKRRMYANTVNIRLREWAATQRAQGEDAPKLWLSHPAEDQWAAIYRRLRRMGADYIRITTGVSSTGANALMVVSTERPNCADAVPVSVDEAIGKLKGAAGRCAGKESRRPFVASKAWKLITNEKKVPPQGWRRVEKLTTPRQVVLRLMAAHRVDYVPVTSRVALDDGLSMTFGWMGIEFSDGQCAAAGIGLDKLMMDLMAGEMLPDIDFSALGGGNGGGNVRDEWDGDDEREEFWRQSG